MLYSFNDAEAKDTHLTQYFENDVWELYNTSNDFSLRNDLARQNPAKLAEMQALFLKQGARYGMLPIDDRTVERMNTAIAGPPDLLARRTSLTVYEGMTGLSENVLINTKNVSHSITAEVEIPKGGAKGGKGPVFVNGKKVAEGRIERTHTAVH